VTYSNNPSWDCDTDLNKLRISSRSGPSRPLRNLNGSVDVQGIKSVSVFFRNIEQELLYITAQYPVVVGSIAWLTSRDFLYELRHREGVSLVVQKEDLWRPDRGVRTSYTDWKVKMRATYLSIKPVIQHRWMCPPICDMGTGASLIDPIRCLGVHAQSKKKTVAPKAHNKFLVFCQWNRTGAAGTLCDLHPVAVWTGSFNITRNSGASFENAVFIESMEVAQKYLEEYAQILALSEPLDWASPDPTPQWSLP